MVRDNACSSGCFGPISLIRVGESNVSTQPEAATHKPESGIISWPNAVSTDLRPIASNLCGLIRPHSPTTNISSQQVVYAEDLRSWRMAQRARSPGCSIPPAANFTVPRP